MGGVFTAQQNENLLKAKQSSSLQLYQLNVSLHYSPTPAKRVMVSFTSKPSPKLSGVYLTITGALHNTAWSTLKQMEQPFTNKPPKMFSSSPISPVKSLNLMGAVETLLAQKGEILETFPGFIDLLLFLTDGILVGVTVADQLFGQSVDL